MLKLSWRLLIKVRTEDRGLLNYPTTHLLCQCVFVCRAAKDSKGLIIRHYYVFINFFNHWNASNSHLWIIFICVQRREKVIVDQKVHFVYNSCWHLLELGEIREIPYNGDWKSKPLRLMSDILKRYPVPRNSDWNVEYFSSKDHPKVGIVLTTPTSLLTLAADCKRQFTRKPL